MKTCLSRLAASSFRIDFTQRGQRNTFFGFHCWFVQFQLNDIVEHQIALNRNKFEIEVKRKFFIQITLTIVQQTTRPSDEIE